MSKYKTVISVIAKRRKMLNVIKREEKRKNPKSRFERQAIAIENKQIFHRFVNSVK